MFFVQRPAADATLSYLFGCAGLQKAVAVDVVAGDEGWFIEAAQRAGAHIVHVLDTHVHADHYSGGRELAQRVGAVYHLHESNQGAWASNSLRCATVSVWRPAMSLHSRLLSLPPEVEIYPGHQAGSACGAGLSGKPTSTIGFEKRFNPMLSMSREAFVTALTAEIPPQPADMARIVEANLRGVVPAASSVCAP